MRQANVRQVLYTLILCVQSLILIGGESDLFADEAKVQPLAIAQGGDATAGSNASFADAILVAQVHEFEDVQFARQVNIRLIPTAIDNSDAMLLTDTALQLADAERKLGRMHRSGITSDVLLKAAIRMAGHNGDSTTLLRLETATDQLNDPSLKKLLVSVRTSQRNSTDEENRLTVDVSSIDVSTAALIHQFHKEIRQAELTKDYSRLEEIQTQIRVVNLPETVSKHLSMQIEQVLSHDAKDLSNSEIAFGKLMADSRSICRKCSGLGRYVRGLGTVRCDRCEGKGTVYDDDGGYVSGWEMETSTSSSGQNIQVDTQVKRRFQFTLWNGCDKAIVHFRLGKNRTEQLSPGARKSYSFTGDSEEATLYIFNTKKSYNLKSGNHKFWWMRDGQVGFDMNNF